MGKHFIFTSESVTDGHPDKLCDQISDGIVDNFLRQDPYSTVRAECSVFNDIVFIAVRFASEGSVDFTHVARKIIREIGYEKTEFSAGKCSVLTAHQQIPPRPHHNFEEDTVTDEEIDKISVRNHVTLFGYACDHSPALMPLPVWLAHKCARRLSELRHQGPLGYLMPEGRIQVSVEFQDRRPTAVHGITCLTGVAKGGPSQDKAREEIRRLVVDEVFKDETIGIGSKTKVFIDPHDRVSSGGPSEHSGLTGRKNGQDTYGQFARQSEKALSGKDPMRIDRVGAYAARYAAKNVVAAGLATHCELQVSYTRGQARPVSLQVETFGTGQVDDDRIAELILEHFEFRLAGIIRDFDLRRLPRKRPEGFFSRLATFGHMGRLDLDLPWEKTDKVDLLRK